MEAGDQVVAEEVVSDDEEVSLSISSEHEWLSRRVKVIIFF